MATEYGLFCKTCDQQQEEFWKLDQHISLIWENRFVLHHVVSVLFDCSSNISEENSTVEFAINHRDHEVILKSEYGKFFNLQGEYKFWEIADPRNGEKQN